MHQTSQVRSEKQLRKFQKQIKKLAKVLPPFEGHDHALNMQTLLFRFGPDGVQAYIGMVDEVIYSYEQSFKHKTMQVKILADNTEIGGTIYSKDQVVDLPILQAKMAFATGKANPVNPDEELSPEAVAETVNHIEAEKTIIEPETPLG